MYNIKLNLKLKKDKLNIEKQNNFKFKIIIWKFKLG